MINTLDLKMEDLPKSNQTIKLYEALVQAKGKGDDGVKIVANTCLMTPENLHVNSFMFEPLIDMSNRHLIYLYNQLKELSE